MKDNAQECLDRLTDELLGGNYTIVSPVGGNQARKIITNEIIKKYKKPPTLKQRIKNIVEKW